MVIKLNFLLSGILVWMVRFADFVFLPDFLENVHRKFPYHLSPFLNFRNLRLDEKLSKYLKFLILKCARSKNRMEIIGTPRESDKVSVFWEKQEGNERQTFVLKILLGTLSYELEKSQIFHLSILFVWLCYCGHLLKITSLVFIRCLHAECEWFSATGLAVVTVNSRTSAK